MRPAFALSSLVAVVLVACGTKGAPATDSESTALAQDGTDTSEVESQVSSIHASLTLASGSATGVPKAAALSGAADTTATFYFPSQCLTVKPLAAGRVEYDFADCTGPWGIFRVTGTIVASFSDTAAGLQIDVGGLPDGGAPAKLQFHNGAQASYQATATITSTGGLQRSMQWTAALSGTTARGRAFMRNASWTTAWTVGESCVTIDGSAQGDVTGRTLDTTVKGFSRCRGECPTAGKVTITNVSASPPRSVEITYDGGDTAAFTGVDGKTYDITLACGL
jgi:hypothetical protein